MDLSNCKTDILTNLNHGEYFILAESVSEKTLENDLLSYLYQVIGFESRGTITHYVAHVETGLLYTCDKHTLVYLVDMYLEAGLVLAENKEIN